MVKPPARGTYGTLTSNKCAKVCPKPKYSPDDIRILVRDVPMDQRSTTRDISAAIGLSMGVPGSRRDPSAADVEEQAHYPEGDDHHDHGVLFDGKVGVWPFVESVPAVRNSRNRPTGTMATSLVNVNATVYRDYVINKVIPAIKASDAECVLPCVPSFVG
ncbi:hypothetical protein H257_09884 [Aphanomyces astaci]|uniref:Uncharacterized protein n=1 Tax=Aphanomyces astaci TaxID=112090 RepID=W4GAE1_APHAT|nr:hypothetical protein H257_09884 [Aphanomyces astaci]ETV75923.1 hypothetical protein H257_09884 [Aphanomyces astaci]|eukprot:XP_009834565.1 hypothetical protein H257_09884 [Aphanomyces astaci]